jgi:hypothetical protein
VVLFFPSSEMQCNDSDGQNSFPSVSFAMRHVSVNVIPDEVIFIYSLRHKIPGTTIQFQEWQQDVAGLLSKLKYPSALGCVPV